MTRGVRLYSARRAAILITASGLGGGAAQVRGLPEKIWKQLAPSSMALVAAL